MASPLVDMMGSLKTTWEGLTAIVDGSGVNYRFIDDLVEERGNGLHRQILWNRPTRARIQAELCLQVEWMISCSLYIHRNDRTQEAFAQAIANEVADLIESYSGKTSWGNSQVLEVVLDTVEISDNSADISTRTSGAIRKELVCKITFPFRVLCGEN